MVARLLDHGSLGKPSGSEDAEGTRAVSSPSVGSQVSWSLPVSSMCVFSAAEFQGQSRREGGVGRQSGQKMLVWPGQLQSVTDHLPDTPDPREPALCPARARGHFQDDLAELGKEK